jgi:DNA-binding PadR family transcriptional regulator
MPQQGAASLRRTPATLAVLSAFTEDVEAWRYGYELIGETGLRSGSLYPILMRLAERGYLDAAWESAPPLGRPPRHRYRLTNAGRELAADEAHAADLRRPRLRPRIAD